MRFYKIFYFILIKLFFIHVLLSQPGFVSPYTVDGTHFENHQVNQTQNEIVFPPLGRASKTNTYFVDHGNCLVVNDSAILIVNKAMGKTEKKLTLHSSIQKSCELSDKTEINVSSAFNKQDGWITYADPQVMISNNKPTTYFAAEWVVPNPPLKKSGQLIYLFVGLGGAHILPDSNSIAYILQPVLQWGVSPAGGGEYWAICNWLVTNHGQYFHDSLIKVNPGDRLQGIVKRLAKTDSTYVYNSSFTGYGQGLDVQNINFWSMYLALETYGVRDCDENPADEKLRMFNIQMIVNDIYPPVRWQMNNIIDHCGEYTNLVHESSQNGEINIHFHKPYSEDNFEDIYLYPNPIQDILHISITNPILRCRIEIYNGLGILMLRETHEILEYEYDLNLTNFSPGIYYIKFYYQKDMYTRETSHTFKFIKTNK